VVVGGSNQSVFAAGPPLAPATGSARVVHAGCLSDAELKALYQQALGLVFPSLYEGFGLPPLEAMACGCPVVAAHAGALPEVCGEAALYVDPTSTTSIEAALLRLATEPAERERLRAAGLARAATFTWRRSAGQLLSEVGAAA